MAKLTQEMKDLIASQMTMWATVRADGTPIMGPKGSTQVVDDETIGFSEYTGKDMWENLKKNPKLSAATVDRQNRKGYRFEGKAEVHTSGPIYEEAKAVAQKRNMNPPAAVVHLKIKDIYNIGWPGAGGKVA